MSKDIILVIGDLLTPSLIIKNYSLTIKAVSSLMIFTDVQTVSRVHITPFYQSIKRNKLEIQKVPQGQCKKSECW